MNRNWVENYRKYNKFEESEDYDEQEGGAYGNDAVSFNMAIHVRTALLNKAGDQYSSDLLKGLESNNTYLKNLEKFHTLCNELFLSFSQPFFLNKENTEEYLLETNNDIFKLINKSKFNNIKNLGLKTYGKYVEEQHKITNFYPYSIEIDNKVL